MQSDAPTNVTFLLNRQWVSAAADMSLLECIRDQMGLTATKPGCYTGDCAACVVALGEPDPREPAGRYRAVNSCLLLCAQVAGCHVITLEGINGEQPHPVQAALVSAGAIQCGYCTPGLVMTLVTEMSNGSSPQQAAAGNLCRCTGYAAISDALARLSDESDHRSDSHGSDSHVSDAALPLSLRLWAMTELSAQEAKLKPPPELNSATAAVIAGGTDWSPAHRHHSQLTQAPRLLRRRHEFRGIQATPDGGLDIGAVTTVSELAEDPTVRTAWPELPGYLELFASPSIRNLATVGGNLANGSPSADLAVILLALGAALELHDQQGQRTLDLADLYLGYRQLALEPGELITRVIIPPRPPGAIFSFDKIARRRTDDVASVNLASLGWLGPDRRVAGLRIAAGGVAATPKLLVGAGDKLLGEVLTAQRFAVAADELQQAIAPIDDVHGRAAYRSRLLRHLVAGQLAAIDPKFDISAALEGCRA